MNHWRERKDWDLIEPPLKPSSDDVLFISDFANKELSKDLNILVLGATPGLMFEKWQRLNSLTVVDNVKSKLSIKDDNFNKIEANWLTMNLQYKYNLIVGDGSIGCIHFNEYDQFITNMYQHMVDESYLALRVFLPQGKSANEIVEDFINCKIKNFHDFKRQLMCSITNENHEFILADVWRIWAEIPQKDLIRVFSLNQWDPDLLRTIESFRNNQNFYTFPSFEVITKMFTKSYFKLIKVHTPHYENGNYYPTIIFKRSM